MAWRGLVSRPLMSTARASTFRSSPTLPCLRTPLSSPGRFPFTNPRTMGELGCVQSLLPLHNMTAGVRFTSHLTFNAREFCDLSNGTFRCSSQAYYQEHMKRSDDEIKDMFESWVVKHGKHYKSIEEKEKRFQIFKDCVLNIDQHNSKDSSYKMGLNQFSDLKNEEVPRGLLYREPTKDQCSNCGTNI